MVDPQDAAKRAAAVRAVDLVRSGMALGLGTGSTAKLAVDEIARRLADGRLRDLVGVPTSDATERQASALGIPLSTLERHPALDLTIDGADEADRALNLIKGAGAALLREKIVAQSSRAMIVIADETKLVAQLGRFPLPVEVIPFGRGATAARIVEVAARLGYADLKVVQRIRDGAAVKTDSGNLVYDCAFGAIKDAPALAAALSGIAGVVEHGLFIGIATKLVIAHPGEVEVIPASP